MYNAQYYIKLYGMRRSGNHAMVAWILQQSGTPQAHFNNVALSRNPINRKRKFRTIKPTISDTPFNLLSHDINTMIVSYESRLLDRASQHTEPAEGVKAINYCELLLLRDFENWLISYIKLQQTIKGQISTKHFRANCRKWVQYAKEFAGLTNYLPNKLTINYNEWHQNGSYRAQLAELIPSIQQFNPDAHLHVPIRKKKPYGKFETNAKTSKDLGVMHRWKLIDEFPAAKQMHKEFPEAMKLSRQIFKTYGR